MSERRLGRSVWAVAAGILVNAVPALMIDQFFHVIEVYPPWGVPMNDTGDNLLALSYRIVLAVAGGWATAALAPRNPGRHVAVLAVIGLILGTLGAVATIPLQLGPAWYPILIALTGPPATLVGGRLARARTGG